MSATLFFLCGILSLTQSSCMVAGPMRGEGFTFVAGDDEPGAGADMAARGERGEEAHSTRNGGDGVRGRALSARRAGGGGERRATGRADCSARRGEARGSGS